MTGLREKPWGRWLALVAAALLLLKSLAMTVSGLFSVTKREVQARGGDVNFVLGLAERRKGAH